MSGFTLFSQTISYLEVLGILTGLAGVWLTIKKNILCFPVGIVNVAIYAYLFFDPSVRLYADAILQINYLILLIYGWLNWKNKENNSETLVRTKEPMMKTAILISIPAFIMLSLFLQNFTNASLPWLDSGLTVLSLLAQWMIARKLLQNWIIWIVVDAIYVPLYFYKNLPLTSMLYSVFLLLAIKGYFDWKKNINSSQTA